jgi:hypothetical protein
MLECLYNLRFFPQPPPVWNAESIRKANQFIRPLNELATIFKICGTFGATFASSKLIISRFKGTTPTSLIIFIEITSLALIALKMSFNYLKRQYFKGLTKEHLTVSALNEFKQVLNELPVCQSEVELQQKLENDGNFTSTLAVDALKAVNEIDHLAIARYRPTKELQPRFEIRSGLTLNQQQDLLNIAYQKGIFLYFSDYEGCIYREFPKAGAEYKMDHIYLEKIQQGFTCSLNFLLNRLESLDDKKIELINGQLRALSFKWTHRSSDEVKIFNPNIYLEDKDTVVIRGNCSEIGDPTCAIEALAPHFKKIKIERVGFLFHNILSFYKEEAWMLFQTNLNTRFPDKMIFEHLLIGMTGIWQENIYQEPTIKDIMSDAVEDQKRLQSRRAQ